ncbi:MAG: GNAT family N-acetyltransferase [Prevotella sp.]|nr:GNAT family N-acetyltransferase [Prevotella sp.]
MSKIKLRAIEPEDLDLLYQIENDTRLWNVGSTNVPYSRYTLHDYIANSSDDIYADRQLRLIIENAEDNTVGLVDLMNFSPQHLRAEVGVVIMDCYRHQGYATAAIEQICDYASRILHLHQLYSIVGTDNTSALKLFTKTGFSTHTMLKEWLFDGKKYGDALIMQRVLQLLT